MSEPIRLLRLVERAHDRLAALDAAPDAAPDGAPDGAPLVTSRDALALGASSLLAALMAACNSRGPEGSERLLRFAERKNEAVERWLLRHTSMDRGRAAPAGDAFPSYYVSPTVPTWSDAARGPWTLAVNGLVDRPLRLSLDDLVRLPRTRQRVNHYCVEGWTAVADFQGVRVAELARLAGRRPEARYVDFRSFDAGYHESWDLESATHPQTLVVYAKDGRFLPPAYGAPARVHSPVKLGYKNTKYLVAVTFLAERNGGYWSDEGYEWYGGT